MSLSNASGYFGNLEKFKKQVIDCFFKSTKYKDTKNIGHIVEGKHVITIEGLGSVDRPHPLQERMARMHGSQ